MRIALISTYELGRQPIHLGAPAASLRVAGHDVAALDLSVESLNDTVIEWGKAVAFSTPMHTALRLGYQPALRIKERRPDVPIASYGLYAEMAIRDPFERAILGEYRRELLGLSLLQLEELHEIARRFLCGGQQ